MTDNPEVANDKEVGSVKSECVADRRRMFRRLLTVAGLAGVAGLLAGRLPGENLLPPVEATGLNLGESNTATGATSLSASPGGVAAFSVTNTDTLSNYDVGLYGESQGPGISEGGGGIGVKGVNNSTNPYGAVGVLGIVENTNITQEWIAGVVGGATSDIGLGVAGYSKNGFAVYGYAPNGTGGYFEGGDLAAIYANGNVGIGTGAPARALHMQADNACFRMDRDVDSSAFILTRTAAGDFSTIWKTFYVGVNASGVNNGEFFIGDAGTAVSGASTMRLWIDNGGTVHIPSLTNGDLAFENGYRLREASDSGLLLLNQKGVTIAKFDEEGNLYVKGEVRKLQD